MTDLPTPEHSFEAPLELEGENGGVFVYVPFNVPETYGTRAQVKVFATFDGFPHRGSLVPLSDGQHILAVPKQVRKTIQKTWGDTVQVTLARDTAPRTVTVPDDLQQALAEAPDAKEFFEQLSYSHRREYVNWIEETRKPETRTRRLAETVRLLSEGRKKKISE